MSETAFIRAIEADDKESTLSDAVAALQTGAEGDTQTVFCIEKEVFHKVPTAPFAYWATEPIRDLFETLGSFGSDGRSTRQGLATADDFRFVRLWWEVEASTILDGQSSDDWRSDIDGFSSWCRQRTYQGRRWVPLSKGGKRSPFHGETSTVINWGKDGNTLKKWAGSLYGGSHWSRIIKNVDGYFRPGLTWPLRGITFSAWPIPAGSIFSIAGKGAFVEAPSERLYHLGLFSSSPWNSMILLFAGKVGGVQYESGLIGRLPYMYDAASPATADLGASARKGYEVKAGLATARDRSHLFVCPALLQVKGETLTARLGARAEAVAEVEAELAVIQSEIDDLAYALYGLSDDDRRALEMALPSGATSAEDADDTDEDDETDAEERVDPAALAHSLVSYALGCAVGRWDVRYGTGERETPPLPDPFAPLPVCSPGMLQGDDGLPLTTPPEGYPLDVDADGVLVDDPDHADDVLARIRAALGLFFDDVESIEAELCELMGEKSLRAYVQKKGGFFKEHVSRYSKSRRKAPIYWYLRSSKGNYGLWIYLHRLDGDTLFKAHSNYVLPKIQAVENELADLRAQRAQAGTSGRDAKRIEKALAKKESLLSELEDFRDKLKRAADLRLAPDLDDGVVLTIAPLHELVPWSEPAKYWDKLLKGEYAWSSIGQQFRDKGLVQEA